MIVPRLIASSIGNKVTPGTYMYFEQSATVKSGACVSYPSVRLCLFPTLAVLTNTDDNVESVVASIQALAMALRPITDEGQGIILEVILELSQRPVTAFVDDFFGTSKVKGFNPAYRLVNLL
jgi:hypothetical protein